MANCVNNILESKINLVVKKYLEMNWAVVFYRFSFIY